jgi:hypothetical protein
MEYAGLSSVACYCKWSALRSCVVLSCSEELLVKALVPVG